MIQNRQEHRRNSGKGRGLVLANCMKNLSYIKPWQQDHGKTTGQGQIHGSSHTVSMEKREYPEESLATRDHPGGPGNELDHIAHQIPMGQDRSFRKSGG